MKKSLIKILCIITVLFAAVQSVQATETVEEKEKFLNSIGTNVLGQTAKHM